MLIDATPLAGPRTGVGHYVAHLVGALVALPSAPDVALAAFTARRRDRVRPIGPARLTGLPVPARLLHRLWLRGGWPRVEWLVGSGDVFHGTNFVLPPIGHAAGVVTIHDLTYELAPELVGEIPRRYRTLVPAALRRGALVLTPSRATADAVCWRYGLDEARIRVTPLGVEPAWSRVRRPDRSWLAARGLPERYIVFVGNRDPRKNLGDLLAAHALLRNDSADAPALVLAGPPGGDAAVEARLHHQDVIATGYLDQPELRQVVAAAACLALPSRAEGFGLPALEAMAAGVPVVASALPVFAEVTGDHARLVPVGDVEALADALGDAAADTDPQAAQARRAWAQTFTWQRCAEQTAAAYEDALGG